MKRKISALAAAFLLPAALVLTVPFVSFAADSTVVYDGGSKLKESNTALTIPVIPGSTETTQIALTNTTGSSTNWYMASEVLRSLEDAGKDATGAAYTYALSYTPPAGETFSIYDSSWIGGEESEGLLEVNASLGEGYFFLGNLGKDETGIITLTIGLNGESAVNNYQAVKGSLKTGFAVEVVPQGGQGGGGKTVQKVTKYETQLVRLDDEDVARSSGRPKTGDESRILLYVILALASGVGCMVMGIGKFRRDTEEGEKSNGKA